MSKAKFSNNEVRSGFLVLTCGLVLLALLFMSGKSQLFEETYDMNIRFNYISGLSKNAPVHLAGHEIGKVTDIHFAGGEAPNVNVTITIQSNAIIREDSDAFINIMGFMGETYIELTSGTRGANKLEANSTLTGTDPIPMMEIVKRGTELMEEFEKSSEALNGIIASVGELLGDNEEEMNNIFQNLDVSSENLKDMTHDLKAHPWKLLRKPEN